MMCLKMMVLLSITGSLILAAETNPPETAAAATESEITGLKWLSADLSDTQTSAWYRMAFLLPPESLQPAADDGIQTAAARLTLAVNGTCVQLYLNGQRLLRDQAFESAAAAKSNIPALGIEISRLLRSGRNVISMQVRSARPSVVAGVRLSVRQADQTWADVNGEWKRFPTEPPAGWPSTDFNDRDWAKIDVEERSSDGDFHFSEVSSWHDVVPAAAGPRLPFYFQDQDHVVLLGATFLERSQQYGHLEAALATVAGTRKVTFRNLGWDGDTVFAESRGIFDPPEAGYLRMIEHVRAEEPTVIIICYGQNDALTNGRTTEQFQNQLVRLVDDVSTTGATIVLMSPHELLPAAHPLPDPSRFNSRIRKFCEVLQTVAAEKSALCVNLFDGFSGDLQHADQLLFSGVHNSEVTADPVQHPDLWRRMAARWSDNGMHLNDRGYQAAALVVRERLLNVPAVMPHLKVDLRHQEIAASGLEVRNAQWSEDGSELVRFELREKVPGPIPGAVRFSDPVDLHRISGVVVSSTGSLPLTADASTSNRGVSASEMLLIPVSDRYQLLRNTIIRKDELYFHRWRPQNITYLFGFRKHEQGNNAVEIAQFDPLVDEQEIRIHELQQPHWRTVVLTRNSE